MEGRKMVIIGDLVQNITLYTHIDRSRSLRLAFLERLQDMHGTAEGGQVVARLPAQQRRLQETPHKLCLDLSANKSCPGHHEDQERQEVIGV